MNDQELADRVVALGPPFPELASAVIGKQMSPYTFVRDWRVAGALMLEVIQGASMIEATFWTMFLMFPAWLPLLVLFLEER